MRNKANSDASQKKIEKNNLPIDVKPYYSKRKYVLHNPSDKVESGNKWNNTMVRPPRPGCPITYRRHPYILAERQLNAETKDAMIECPICCEPMALIATGKCRDFVCWVCSVKMRCLQNNKACPFCKMHLDVVLIMTSPFTAEDKQSFVSRFSDTAGTCPAGEEDEALIAKLQTIDLDTKSYEKELYDESHGLLYATQDIKRAVKLLFDWVCWHPLCTSELAFKRYRLFETADAWIAHSAKQHKAIPCNVCLEGRKIFPFEQLLFDPKDISRHFKEGDRNSNPAIHPHVNCFACNKSFFDVDAYATHVKENHVSCYICDRLAALKQPPTSAPAFPSFVELDDHYRREHHSCPQCSYVAFQTIEELTVHTATVHSGTGRVSSISQQDTRPRPGPQQFRRPQRERPAGDSSFQNRYVRSGITRHSPDEQNNMGRPFSRRGGRGQNIDSSAQITSVVSEEAQSRDTAQPTALTGTSTHRNDHIKTPHQTPERFYNRRLPLSSENLIPYWRYRSETELMLSDFNILQDCLTKLLTGRTSSSIAERRDGYNELLFSAMQDFLMDNRLLSECRAYSNDFLNLILIPTDFLKKIVKVFWETQSKHKRNRRQGRGEPHNWKTWRKNYPYISPAADVLILLILAAANPILLLEAFKLCVADLKVKENLQKTREEVPSAASSEEYIVNSETAFNNEALPTIANEQHSKSLETPPGLKRPEPQHFLPHQEVEAFNTSSLVCREDDNIQEKPTLFMKHYHDRQKTESSRSGIASASKTLPLEQLHEKISGLGKSPNNEITVSVSQNSSAVNDSNTSAIIQTILPDTLPELKLVEQNKRTALKPKSVSERGNVSNPLLIVGANETERKWVRSDSDIVEKYSLEEANLPIGKNIPFLEAVKTALYVHTEHNGTLPQDISERLKKTELPCELIEKLRAASKNSLAMLSGLLPDSHDRVNPRTIEQFLSLRAMYYLLTKQAPETASRDWGRRCSTVFHLFAENELYFVKSYVELSLASLPRAVLFEEFPELPASSTPLSSPPLACQYPHVKQVNSSTGHSIPHKTHKVSAPTKRALISKFSAGKLTKSSLKSETLFPSLDEGVTGNAALCENDSWLTKSTQNHAAGLGTTTKIKRILPSPFPAQEFITQPSSSSSRQPHYTPTTFDFPDLGNFDRDDKTVSHQLNRNNAQLTGIPERVVGGVGPLRCTSCTYGNQIGKTKCQLCGSLLLK